MANDNWETPPELFNLLNSHFHFTLDVAASHENHKCIRYFTELSNGLMQEWDGVCWCNPPYSDIMPWVMKAADEVIKGVTTVMLLPVDTSTKWFEQCFLTANDIIFLQPRVQFVGSTGSPRWANMLVVWQPDILRYMTSGNQMSFLRWK
jgi:phage N-6-adenine-methyltransferase